MLVELLDFRQTDLNPVNNRLLFEISAYGDLPAICNLQQVEEQWRGLRPQIIHRYGQTPDGMAFINGFEQQLRSDALITNLKHKGAYGILFPGLFGPTGAIRNGVSVGLVLSQRSN